MRDPPMFAEPAVALRQRSGHLPVEVDSFVGRRHELAEVRRLFTVSPLVTLAGMGGVGKTRLALRAASSMSRSFLGGIAYVELGKLHDSALILPTLAEGLGIHERSSSLSLETLVDWLRDRGTLLVLDNCEHLLTDAARLVDALVRGCPELRVLATSREPLGIHGESTLRVPPLTVPDPTLLGVSASMLSQYEAVHLFTDRASAASPDFELTEHNCAEVARICHQLDGVPLALELAAARLRTLSPRQLADRLADRYQLLTGGSRVAPERHQTLRLCVDWSHDQCSTREQTLWSRLAVFVGDFDLDAVEATCAFGALQEHEILDLLSSLVDKSIVSRKGVAAGVRFGLLETLREYGKERLIESGEYAEMRRRHRDWYEQMVQQLKAELIGPDQLRWASWLDHELPNVRAALDYSLSEEGESGSAPRIVSALNLYWISRGLLSEGRYWLRRTTKANIPPNQEQIESLYSAVALAGLQGDLASAGADAARCQDMAHALDTPESNAYAANAAGALSLFSGDLIAAVAKLERAIELQRRTDGLTGQIEMLIAHATACALLGDGARATASHQQVLAITQARGEAWYQAYSLWAYGLAMWRDGELEAAKNVLVQSLRLRRKMSDVLGSVWCLEALAFVASTEERWEHAATLMGASAALSQDAGTPTGTFVDLGSVYSECQQQARKGLGDHGFDKAFAHGSKLDYEAAVEFAVGEQAKSPKAASQPAPVLTPRQREVAKLVAQGLTDRAIAKALVISERTAEGHVENILVKLGFTSRTQIATWWVGQ